MVHNGTTVYCCGVRNMQAACFMYMHVGDSEESSSAMAEWAMFDAAVRHICWTDFFETWIRAIAQSILFVRKGNQVFVPSLHRALRTTCQTD